MAEYKIQDTTLNAIANAINAKTGGSSAMTPAQMVTAIGTISGGGGSISQGLEVTETDSNGRITKATWHGDVPDYAMNYFLRGSPTAATISLGNCETIGAAGCAFSTALLDGASLNSVKYLGNGSFQANFNATILNANGITLNLEEFTGFTTSAKTARPGDLFRGATAYGYTGFYLPKAQTIGHYWWYQSATQNISVQVGSVGFPVNHISSGQRPFGNATGSGTVTVYTTGAMLDSVSAFFQNQAGANYTFVYKAAEATTYGGTSYAAGDTMLTV